MPWPGATLTRPFAANVLIASRTAPRPDTEAGFEFGFRRERRADWNYIARDLAAKRCENGTDAPGFDASCDCFRAGFHHRI